MIIVFPNIIVVFQLIDWCIVSAEKSMKSVKYHLDMLGFSFLGTPSRE